MGATDWLNVPKKKHRQAVKSVEQALAESAVAPNVSTEIPSVIIPHELYGSIDAPGQHPGQQNPFNIGYNAIPINAQHTIRIRIYNASDVSQVIVFVGKCMTRNGQIKNIIAQVSLPTPTAATPNNTYIVALPDDAIFLMSFVGYLSANLSNGQSTAVKRGIIYISARLMITATPLDQATTQNSGIAANTQVISDVLFQGYLTSGEVLSIGKNENALDGRGAIRTLQMQQPSAGSEANWYFQSTGIRYRIIALIASLTASGTAANRNVTLNLLGGTGTINFFQMFPGEFVTAGLTRVFGAASSGDYGPGAPASERYWRLPEQTFVDHSVALNETNTPPATILSSFATTTTGAIAAGDQYSGVVAHVEQWVLPNIT